MFIYYSFVDFFFFLSCGVPGDLKFSVAVNGKVNNLDLSGGSHLKLPVLKTDKPVNVSIKLSGSFPPSTVTITRYYF